MHPVPSVQLSHTAPSTEKVPASHLSHPVGPAAGANPGEHRNRHCPPLQTHTCDLSHSSCLLNLLSHVCSCCEQLEENRLPGVVEHTSLQFRRLFVMLSLNK